LKQKLKIDKLKTTRLNLLHNLYKKWSKEEIISINKLPISGSSREYYRISGSSKTAIGVINEVLDENISFIEFSKHFKSKKLNVPTIYSIDLDNHIYLQEDLGDTTLFSYLIENNSDIEFSKKIIDTYKNVLKELPKFQIEGNNGLNYDLCFPRSKFDKQSMQWDLN
jgi:aminoglycoside/choline kinase family phosphotransferase